MKTTVQMVMAAWDAVCRIKPKGRDNLIPHKHCYNPLKDAVTAIRKAKGENRESFKDEDKCPIEIPDFHLSYLLQTMNKCVNEGVEPVLVTGYVDMLELLESIAKKHEKEEEKK